MILCQTFNSLELLLYLDGSTLFLYDVGGSGLFLPNLDFTGNPQANI